MDGNVSVFRKYQKLTQIMNKNIIKSDVTKIPCTIFHLLALHRFIWTGYLLRLLTRWKFNPALNLTRARSGLRA